MEYVILAISILSSLYAQQNAKKTAEEVNEAQLKQFAARRKVAENAFKNEVFAIRARDLEQQSQVAEQAERVVTDALNVRGVVLATAGTANVGGQAVTDVLNEFTRQEISSLTRLNLFQKFRTAQTETAIRAASTTLDLRVASFLPGPSVVPAGLDAGQLLGAVGQGLQLGAAAKDANLFGQKPASINKPSAPAPSSGSSLNPDAFFQSGTSHV